MSSLAQRKLAALKAKSALWNQRSNERISENNDQSEEEEDEADGREHADATVVSDESQAKRQKVSENRTSAATEHGAELLSDATEAEQAALAAMGFTTSFGAAPKPQIDLSAAHAARARQAEAVLPTSSKIKLEVASATSSTSNSKVNIAPKKVAVPVAPAALLGGMYDSDSDSDADGADNNAQSAAASSASSSAAAASSVAKSAAPMSDSDEDSDEEPENDPATLYRTQLLSRLPITHEAAMKTNGHTKSVSALAVDKSGSRVISGGYDYQVKFWDFSGMNESLAAFRSIEPQEGHQVRQLQFSQTSDSFLAVTGGAQPKVYSRDGIEQCQFARGDMYILDQKQTKGHSSAVTAAQWNPMERHCVMTGGIDGTVRLWDINVAEKNAAVHKPRGLIKGIGVSAAAFSTDGKIIAAAYTDGSIHLLKYAKGFNLKEDKHLSGAHARGSETSSLLFSSDGFSLFSRGGSGDDTIKQWDIRAFKQPIQIVGGLTNAYPETDMAFSPDEKLLVTGTSSREGNAADSSVASEAGQAIIIERSSMKPLQRVSLGCKGVIRSVWHPTLNQLLFGCSDGGVRILYDPQMSTKGVLQCLGRKQKPKALTDFSENVGHIINPHALPAFRSEESASRKRAREKASAAMAPEAPVVGRKGVGGRAAGEQSLTAYHLSKYVALKHDPREKDPREALLAMDELAKKDPMFFGNAYKNTQPVTILAEVDEKDKIQTLSAEEMALTNKKEGQTH